MSDLISRQALIDVLHTYFKDGFDEDRWWNSTHILTVIRALPSAQPVRKGKWVKENIVLTSNPPQYQWHCSECGKIMRGFSAEVLTDYCSSCGADMRGEND